MYFLPTQLTNRHAGFSPHMHSTAKFTPILHADWSVNLGENKSHQRSQTYGGYAMMNEIEIFTYSTTGTARSP